MHNRTATLILSRLRDELHSELTTITLDPRKMRSAKIDKGVLADRISALDIAIVSLSLGLSDYKKDHETNRS